jgi:iron(III) transport system substrate-binding protein
MRQFLLLKTASVTLFVILFSVTAKAASVEERLEQLNRMTEKMRSEALEKEARKEGEVVWYAAMAGDRAGELIKVFESRYPFLRVRFQPGGASRQIEQLIVEHRAKKHRADIINTRRSFVGVMAKAGAIARYRTPLRGALREGFADKEGWINGIYAQPRVFLFNTRMIARDKAPQSIEDLVDPRWKDKLGMDTTDYDWLASLIDFYGRSKALELAGKLAKQQLNMRRGPTLLAQLAVAGEFPVVIDAFPEEVTQMKSAKAPVDFIFSEPFVPVKTPTTVSISSAAPHPWVPLIPLSSYRVLPDGRERNFAVYQSQKYLVQQVPLNTAQVRDVYRVAVPIALAVTALLIWFS